MPGGRPSKLTPALQESLLHLLEQGLPYQICCDSVDIDYSTFKQWRIDNPTFSAAVKRANAKAVTYLSGRIREGEQGWQAASWILERRHSNYYSKHRETAAAFGSTVIELLKKKVPMEHHAALEEAAQDISQELKGERDE